MADFEVKFKDLPGISHAALACVKGFVDFTTAGHFRHAIETARARGVKRIVLDLEGMTYINSGGLSTIINFAGTGNPQFPSVVLMKIQPKVRVVFEVMKLGGLFRYCETLDEAVQILKGSEDTKFTAR